MSLVTTPSLISSASAPHSAAIRLLLPDPTGPPTPIRKARSAGKEALPLFEMDGCVELDRDRGGRGQRAIVRGDAGGGARHVRREVREPARRDGRVERQELERRARDRGRVVVEREQ